MDGERNNLTGIYIWRIAQLELAQVLVAGSTWSYINAGNITAVLGVALGEYSDSPFSL